MRLAYSLFDQCFRAGLFAVPDVVLAVVFAAGFFEADDGLLRDDDVFFPAGDFLFPPNEGSGIEDPPFFFLLYFFSLDFWIKWNIPTFIAASSTAAVVFVFFSGRVTTLNIP